MSRLGIARGTLLKTTCFISPDRVGGPGLLAGSYVTAFDDSNDEGVTVRIDADDVTFYAYANEIEPR